MEVLHDLVGYKNRKIYQNTEWFSFSIDSILLARFVTLLPRTKRILDIGTGTAPIPLILSLYTKAHIDAVEIQEDVSTLAQKTIILNQLSNQVHLFSTSIQDYTKSCESDTYDVITCNPPYFKAKETSYFNIDIHKKIARHEISLSLEEVIKCAKKLLKNDGVLAMVHQTDRLIDLITLFRENGIEPKKIQFVYPQKGKKSNICLIEGRKHGKTGVTILEPLYVLDESGNYTEDYLKILEQ